MLALLANQLHYLCCDFTWVKTTARGLFWTLGESWGSASALKRAMLWLAWPVGEPISEAAARGSAVQEVSAMCMCFASTLVVLPNIMGTSAPLGDCLAGPAQAMMMMRSVVHVTFPEDTSGRDRPDEAGQLAGQGGREPLATHDSGSSVWQLVTAHSNGQLQVWDPSLGSIKPVLRIGDPCSSCRFEPMRPFAKKY